jgi:hypothetical protein
MPGNAEHPSAPQPSATFVRARVISPHIGRWRPTSPPRVTGEQRRSTSAAAPPSLPGWTDRRRPAPKTQSASTAPPPSARSVRAPVISASTEPWRSSSPAAATTAGNPARPQRRRPRRRAGSPAGGGPISTGRATTALQRCGSRTAHVSAVKGRLARPTRRLSKPRPRTGPVFARRGRSRSGVTHRTRHAGHAPTSTCESGHRSPGRE